MASIWILGKMYVLYIFKFVCTYQVKIDIRYGMFYFCFSVKEYECFFFKYITYFTTILFIFYKKVKYLWLRKYSSYFIQVLKIRTLSSFLSNDPHVSSLVYIPTIRSSFWFFKISRGKKAYLEIYYIPTHFNKQNSVICF